MNNKLYILDTDHVSLFQRQHPVVVQHLAGINAKTLAVTIITVDEQVRGRLIVIKRANSMEKLIQAYGDLQASVAYFNKIQVLPFDKAAYAYYDTLRQQKIRIGSQDLRIASIVLSIKGVLVTRNWKDFGKVPDLTLEDWSIS
ncbi:MAG: type II toxin-antitoxin system VapC family toxin [Candidatus Parabeggiatoa sp. nov. 3]|jgi:tRNA(fMet)-specific endonuclease VapC|nr:MAG: type II toxin-antitoxin system VapC family toxin [Gammaproteobacteria bacterium]RKZ60082.1 MAG: type II toxin-antitoxin system VapC family toxin [Gammaproteobacteria bacterium]RKZ83905.1 MAG: type II toxin-antitoxin system VapC family toxin [Gammaproteobacteria bacterium]HEW97364.1 type II toxin-antitoxin system VapC family toxin [Beggiatoa sp.]